MYLFYSNRVVELDRLKCVTSKRTEHKLGAIMAADWQEERMGTEQAKALVERFFDEAWVKHNNNIWDELPEDVVFWNFGTKIEGRESWLQAFVRL